MVIFKKFRLFSWTTKAFIAKHGRTILASSIIGIIGFFLVYKLIPYLSIPKRGEKIARIGRCDPDNLPQDILKFLSVGLITLADDGSPAPGLAESWEISEDGLTYTFTLMENLFWQDETPVKAEDIDLHFNDVEKNVVDEKTIIFKLKEPFSPFLTILSKPVFKNGYLGVGPYKVKQIKKTANLVEKIVLTSPEKDISVRFYPNEESAILGFKLGEVDVIEGLFSYQMEEDWKKNIEIEEAIAKDQYLGVFFNTEHSIFTDKAIRQAFAYSIPDKPRAEERATGPISPLSWAYNSNVKLYEFDASKAKELFKKDDDNEEENNSQQRIKISTSEPFLEIAEQMEKSWEELFGLEIDIELINILDQNYEVFLGIQQIPPDPDQYVLWHSTREENITNFKSPKIDKLLEDARKISILEDRKEKYFDFQKAISEESPVVFLSYPTVYKIKRKKLSFF